MSGKREKVIEKFIRKNKFKIGAELGVWKGRTFKHLINTFSDLKIIGVDLYSPQLDSKGPEKWIPGENGHEWDHENYYTDLIEFCKKNNDRGIIIRDYTFNAAKMIENFSLDFVFIDADHSYESVKKDIEDWDPKVKPGGIVFGHDIDWPTVKRAVEEKYGKDYKIEEDNVWYHVKNEF